MQWEVSVLCNIRTVSLSVIEGRTKQVRGPAAGVRSRPVVVWETGENSPMTTMMTTFHICFTPYHHREKGPAAGGS